VQKLSASYELTANMRNWSPLAASAVVFAQTAALEEWPKVLHYW
jgi:hypothetical protein